MKCEICGRVVSRTRRTTPKGELYSLEIEEPGLYPSVFQVSSRDVTLFGKSDGPFAVGALVRVTAFANSKVRQAIDSNGKAFRAFSVWFTASRIERIEAVENSGADPSTPKPVEPEPEDIPF